MRNLSALALVLVKLVLVLPCETDAQSAGKLRFIVDPGGDFSFVLDHQFRLQQREIDLATGPHSFTFWAPERKMIDTTITVEAGPIKEVLIRLPYSDEYRGYLTAMRDMRNKAWVEVALPSAVTLAAATFAVISYGKCKDAADRLDADEDLYKTSGDPGAIATLKYVTIPNHRNDLKDRRATFYIASGFFAVAAAGTAWLITRNARRPLPKFNDAQKVKFDGLVWVPSERGGMFMAGLHLDLR